MFKSRSASDAPVVGANSIIGAGTVITGDIQTSGDIRIDGTLKGNLVTRAKVLIGPEGSVDGDIKGQQADILGNVKGTLTVADLLHLRGKASINGDVYAGKLQVEPTVTFNGQCHMGANVVELNTEMAAVVNQ
jgi:cytoskeletal protein CcmA (bactofilin family)